jgi:hypothetical protein
VEVAVVNEEARFKLVVPALDALVLADPVLVVEVRRFQALEVLC